jgi:hypothetical protein
MSITSARQWQSDYLEEQLHQQKEAVARGLPVKLSPTRQAQLLADQKAKSYLEDLAAIFLDLRPGAEMYASELYCNLVWPGPVPLNYRKFIRLLVELFPQVKAVERDCNGVRRVVLLGVEPLATGV